MYTVLVVDDDPFLQESLSGALRDEYVVQGCLTVDEAVSFLKRGNVDIVLLDISFPEGRPGLDLLDELPASPFRPAVIMITGEGGVSSIVTTVRRGACDYLVKPFTPDQVRQALSQVVSRSASRRVLESGPFGGFIGLSPPVVELKRQLQIYAPSNCTVLFLGESGTGKEVAAEALHRLSPRCKKRFVRNNIAAIQDTLLESDLFGCARGAFTGAEPRAGLFEEASGGTLFLDEIGDLDPGAQVRLLRVVETKSIRRLGGTSDLELDVRLVLATNRDLRQLVRAGQFRADLYYRISPVTLTMPPLRERGDDVLLLAEWFLNRCGKTREDITPAALDCITGYSWPGNVRELKAVVEKAALLSGPGRIGPEHIQLNPP